MRYMLLCCFDERRWAEMPEPQRRAIMREYGEFVQGIVRSGHHPAGGAIEVRPVMPTSER
jgi:hypothetical protein